ncbi:MAG: ankyrin repeat domain-containing protein [Gallionellaceae bacterium]
MKLKIKSSEVLILLAASTMSFLANLPDSVLGNLVDRKTLLIALTALVVVAMIRYLQIAFLLAISILAIGANLPAELASALGVSQLALLVSLGIMIAIYLFNRAVKLLPTGEETSSEIPAYTRQSLLTAIMMGDVVTLHRLMSMNVDVNFIEGGMTPLHLAAQQGNIEIVRILIAQGADYRKNTSDGKSLTNILIEKNNNTQANANKGLLTQCYVEARRGNNESWGNQHV